MGWTAVPLKPWGKIVSLPLSSLFCHRLYVFGVWLHLFNNRSPSLHDAFIANAFCWISAHKYLFPFSYKNIRCWGSDQDVIIWTLLPLHELHVQINGTNIFRIKTWTHLLERSFRPLQKLCSFMSSHCNIEILWKWDLVQIYSNAFK